MYKKPVIVFEGIDCSGKTTQISFVSKYLKERKIPFIKFREPGGSSNSEKIRNLLLNNKSNLNIKTDLLLYLAARAENIEKIIKINKSRKIILIDRFIDSTYAYQHYAMGIDKRIINLLNNFVTENIKADFTFLSTVNKKNLIKRLKNRKKLNRYDSFKINFYLKAQKGFISIAKNKRKYLVVNSNLDLKKNFHQITNKLIELKLR